MKDVQVDISLHTMIKDQLHADICSNIKTIHTLKKKDLQKNGGALKYKSICNYIPLKKYASKKDCNKRGLMNQIDKLLYLCVSQSAGILNYLDYVPQVNWLHSWTDEEILEEIGLPKDFLAI